MDSQVPRLSVICEDFFLFITTFRRRIAQGPLSTDWVRERIEEVLSDISAKVNAYGGRTYDLYEKARYLLVVTADGIILNSTWEHANEWRLLEATFEGTAEGGERFFELLTDPGYQDPELLEIFYLCLGVGFEGDYLDQTEVIRQKRRDLYNRLEGIPRDATERITPQAYEETRKKKMPTLPAVKFLRLAICFTAVIAIFVGLATFFYDSQIESVISKSQEIMERHRQSMK